MGGGFRSDGGQKIAQSATAQVGRAFLVVHRVSEQPSVRLYRPACDLDELPGNVAADRDRDTVAWFRYQLVSDIQLSF